MKKVKLGALVLFVSLIALPVFSAGIKFENLSLKEGLKKAKKENKKVFIDIYATWCGPCKYLTKSVFTDKALGAYMNEHFVNLKLDGEKSDGGSLMELFELNSFPTMLFLDPDKDLLKKIVGAVSAGEIKDAALSVVDPTSTEIYKLTKEFESGNREKEFLQKFIVEQLNNDVEMENSVKIYLEKFPKLDMDEENEFLIFCLGVSESDNENMLQFRKDIKHYNELFPSFVEAKLMMMIGEIIAHSVEVEDVTIAKQEIKALYPDYYKVHGNEGYSEDELTSEVCEIVLDELSD